MASRGDRSASWELAVWSGLALLYLFIPIFIVVLFSFNDTRAASTSRGRASRSSTGSTRSRRRPREAMKNSFLIAPRDGDRRRARDAAGARAGPLPLSRPWRRRPLVFLPMATPEVVLGAALLALFLTSAVNSGFVTILIAHVMFTMSYVVVTVKARLEGMDPPHRGGGRTSGPRARRSARSRCRSSPRASRGRAGGRALDRRLRRHELQRRPDRRSRSSSSARRARACRRGQRAGDAAARRARPDGLNVLMQRAWRGARCAATCVDEPESAALVPARG